MRKRLDVIKTRWRVLLWLVCVSRKSHHLRLNNQDTQIPTRMRSFISASFAAIVFPLFVARPLFLPLPFECERPSAKKREGRLSGRVEPAKKTPVRATMTFGIIFQNVCLCLEGGDPDGRRWRGGQGGGRGVVNPRGVGWQDGVAR